MAKENWRICISRQENRARQIIIEGYASLIEERPVPEEVPLLLVVGPDYLSLEVSRDLQGERLLAHFMDQLGPPATQPKVIVGGHEEESALLMVEWAFPRDRRPKMIERLGALLGQPLAS